MEVIIIIGISMVLYYLSFLSPRTDLILYGMSGLVLLLGSVALLSGQIGVPIGETVTTDGNHSTYMPVYSTSVVNTTYLPLMLLLMSLYILFNLGLDMKNGKQR